LLFQRRVNVKQSIIDINRPNIFSVHCPIFPIGGGTGKNDLHNIEASYIIFLGFKDSIKMKFFVTNAAFWISPWLAKLLYGNDIIA